MIDIVDALKIANTVVSIAKPIIETLAPKLQSDMKGFAERMLVLSEKYPSLSEFAQVIDSVSDILGDILFALGIETDSATEMGYKISQAEKGAGDFDSIEDYIDYLKNEVEVDEEKLDNLSEGEKLAYTLTGMAVEAGAIGEKLNIEISADGVELISKIAKLDGMVFNAKEIITVISSLKENGINTLTDVCECIAGEGQSDRLRTRQVLTESLEGIRPGEGADILNRIKDELRM